MFSSLMGRTQSSPILGEPLRHSLQEGKMTIKLFYFMLMANINWS